MSESKHAVHFTSDRQDWGTPPEFLDYLLKEFNWKPHLDVCAAEHNAKAPAYFTIEDDSLTRDWYGHVWINPPFGKELPKFMEKCEEEYRWNPEVRSIVALVPARTDTVWAQRAMANATNVWLIKGRFNFRFDAAVKGANAPFPSMLIVWGYPFPTQSLQKIDLLEVPKEARGFGGGES